MKKIFNFIKTIFRFILALIRYAFFGHFTNVTFEEYADRLSKCASCENLNKKQWRCKICGCYLSKKAKWTTEHCPQGKWQYDD